MKLGIFHFAPFWGNKEQNLRKIEETIASYSGIDLWILPELCTTGYLQNRNRPLPSDRFSAVPFHKKAGRL